MLVGIPKEILHQERRVAATPETVEKLCSMGFQVVVQRGAGEGAFIADEDYARAGATITADVPALFATADLVLKVKQPHYNEELERHEAAMLKEGSILVTFLHPAAPGNHSMIMTLARRGITAFTMDGVPRVSRAQRMDALTSMSTITGYKSVLLAANQLGTFMPMVTTAIGTLKPAKVLIVGTGVVGLQAVATAKRLGAVVSAVDIRPEAREEAKSLGAKVVGFEVPPEVARGEGGYALALPPDLVEQERRALAPVLAESDVVILSALVPGEVAPLLVTSSMVAGMKPGSAIVDVAIDQGGNCASTQPGAQIVEHGVSICGVQNIPGSMPVHATKLYASNLLCYVQNLFKKGLDTIDWEDPIVSASLVTHKGKLLHHGTLKAMGQAVVNA